MRQINKISECYKDSPLGIIPKEWEVKRLGDLGVFSKGKGVPKDKIIDKGYKCLTYGDIYTKYDIMMKNVKSFIDAETAEESQEIQKGDILFTGSGETLEDIGKAIVYLDDEKGYAGGDIIIFKNSEPINSLWLSYFLNSSTANSQKNKMGQGHSVVHIYSSQLEKLKILFPPLPEQQKIAEILSLWDEAIEKETQLIAQLETRKRGLMQQLLTGKKRLKGFSGEWKKVAAGSLFKNVSVKGFDDEELLSATQDKGILPRKMLETKVTMPSKDTNTFKLVETGDFVISLRSFQGGIEYSYYRGIVSPAYTVLKSKSKIVDVFYKYYFKSYDFIGHLAIAVIGIRDGKQISYEDFCFVKIPSPSIEEQTSIANILSSAEKDIDISNQKLSRLKEQKKGLMQQLLTGKKRVKTNKI